MGFFSRKKNQRKTMYLANIDQKGLQFKVRQEFTLELVTTYSSCTIYFHSRNAIHWYTFWNIQFSTHCENYVNLLSHFFHKNSVNASFWLKKLQNSWFHEIFQWEWISCFSTLCSVNNCRVHQKMMLVGWGAILKMFQIQQMPMLAGTIFNIAVCCDSHFSVPKMLFWWRSTTRMEILLPSLQNSTKQFSMTSIVHYLSCDWF